MRLTPLWRDGVPYCRLCGYKTGKDLKCVLERCRTIEFKAYERKRNAALRRPIKPLKEVLEDKVIEALYHFDGDVDQSASALGISISTLRTKIRKLVAAGRKVPLAIAVYHPKRTQ